MRCPQESRNLSSGPQKTLQNHGVVLRGESGENLQAEPGTFPGWPIPGGVDLGQPFCTESQETPFFPDISQRTSQAHYCSQEGTQKAMVPKVWPLRTRKHCQTWHWQKNLPLSQPPAIAVVSAQGPPRVPPPPQLGCQTSELPCFGPLHHRLALSRSIQTEREKERRL